MCSRKLHSSLTKSEWFSRLLILLNCNFILFFFLVSGRFDLWRTIIEGHFSSNCGTARRLSLHSETGRKEELPGPSYFLRYFILVFGVSDMHPISTSGFEFCLTVSRKCFWGWLAARTWCYKYEWTRSEEREWYNEWSQWIGKGGTCNTFN